MQPTATPEPMLGSAAVETSGSLTLDETGAGETADTTAGGQDAVPETVPETVENNDALADDTAPAEQPAA